MKFIPQQDLMDCGPACLSMVCDVYGKHYDVKFLREQSFITREGVSLLGISEAAEKIGFETFSAKLSTKLLIEEKQSLPCILHWNKNHFVVLYKIKQQVLSKKYIFKIADPAYGFINVTKDVFEKSWISEQDHGIALFLSPAEKFYHLEAPVEKKLSLKFLFAYLLPYKKKLISVFLMLIIGSGLTLIFPFLTQNLIDKGVNAKNLNLISLILLAQLGVFFGTVAIEVFRNWIMLYVGTKISITIISDFFKKILQLPIAFFETKLMGDFNQRIQDNERIENFLTSQSLLTFFSIITFSVFFGVLWYYDIKIVLVFAALTIASLLWSFYWLRKRKILDYYRFQQRSEHQESIYEIIEGATEIKLNDFEDFKRNAWEDIQKKLFITNTRILKVDQIQNSGFEFINQLKNILVTFLSAKFVVQGSMTLGELLAISYIIGQLNSPINQLIGFFRSLQDARLSLERLNEVHFHKTEEQKTQKALLLDEDIKPKGIVLTDVSFQYEGPRSPFILRNLNLTIPDGKVTAIVGASGSGKSTLMKLLLKFYDPISGIIKFNDSNILELSPKNLRKNCGVVLQDGYIFSDTIERNIATSDREINRKKLTKAVNIANITTFIKELPLRYNTKIGAAGNGISGGQKQRILIARAVYKNPHYIFFDEATSALDAENERIIHDNLQSFFKGKTVVIIAHRLSTVKHADQIIVLKKGQVVEQGKHHELVALKKEYFNLVHNQLELGN